MGPDGTGPGVPGGPGAGGPIDAAQLLNLATNLMPSQHRLLLGRSAAGGSAAAASAALAESNVLPLGAAQQSPGPVAGGGSLVPMLGRRLTVYPSRERLWRV